MADMVKIRAFWQHFFVWLFHTYMTRQRKNIDPMQKWLPLNYSFVHIQNSPTNLVFETKILKNLLSLTRSVGLILNMNKRII